MATTTTFTRTNYAGFLGHFAPERSLLNLVGGIRAGPDGMMDVGLAKTIKFSMGQFHTVAGGSQPAISEDDAQAGKAPTTKTRSAEYNVVQIFQESTDVSYYADSDDTKVATAMGISGADTPIDEEVFQIAAHLEKVATDLDYTMMKGTYHEPSGSDDPAGTRGIATACSTNLINASGATISKDLIKQLVRSMFTNGAPRKRPVIFAPAALLDDITDLYEYQPQSWNVGGTEVNTILTNFGKFGLEPCVNLADTEIVIVDLEHVHVVGLPVRDKEKGGYKGVLFDEPLARVGGGDKHQIYGQLSVDYGSEKYHGRIYDLAT